MLAYLMAAGCEPGQVVIIDVVLLRGRVGMIQIIDDCVRPCKKLRTNSLCSGVNLITQNARRTKVSDRP